jgi:hypothetical protein
VLSKCLLNDWVWHFSIGGPWHLFLTGCLQHHTIEGHGGIVWTTSGRKWNRDKRSAWASPLTLPIAPFPSGMKTALQRVPGNVHPCAISKLPHGKQANFAHTPAVCLISDFYSELEEKILSLDLVWENEKLWSQRKPCYYSDICHRGNTKLKTCHLVLYKYLLSVQICL